MSSPLPYAVFPPLVPAKGTIGIVAPSRWPRKDMLEVTVERFEARGYDVVVHDQCFMQFGTMAGPEAARAEAFNDMFADRTIDAVFCARGGSGAMMLLERLDYELIRANPKPVIGSSDVTVLLQAITKHTGMVTFHGPMAYYMLPEHFESYTEEDLFYMIAGDRIERRLRFPMVEVERPGVAEGRLVGGNLTMLESLVGTPYDWSGEGAVLFIEDVDEALYSIERTMIHLRMAGKFEGVRAVLVGEMIGVPEERAEDMQPGDAPYARSLKEIMLRHLPPEIPLGFNYPCGHGRYLTTFPVGACVRVTVTDDVCDMVVRP
ncbi:MAG: LD-carboxypeptidase [Bdellovibrionales bacterium]